MKITKLTYPKKADPNLRSQPVTVALGFFDGFHRGHQALVREAVYRAEQTGTRTCIYTFDRYPKPSYMGYAEGAYERYADSHVEGSPGEEGAAQVSTEAQLELLTDEGSEVHGLLQTQEQKLRRLSEEGIDEILIQNFNETFSQLSPEEFLDYLCQDLLQVSHLLVGEDFGFGKDGAGDLEILRSYCAARDISLSVIPQIRFRGEAISSTRIREAVTDGDFPLVSQLLGRHYTQRGKVIRGNRLAHSFDFPTANFRPEKSKVVPPYGVYVTRAWIDGRSYPAITNFGLRPTVNATDPDPLVETTIFGTKMDLYEKEIEVDFLRFIREETKFRSLLIMTTQIHRDIDEALQWHASSEDLHLGYQADGTNLYLCHANRFRRGRFELYFYLPLEARKTSARVLLARLMTQSSARYPEQRDFLMALEACYGASFTGRSYGYGTTQVVHFEISTLDLALEGRRPMSEAIDLVMDAILNPALDEDGNFSEEAIDLAKQSVIAELQQQRDKKSYETERRFLKQLTEGTGAGIDAAGDPAIIASLTPEDLREAWEELRREAQIDVLLAGDYNMSAVSQVIELLRALRLSGGEIYSLKPGRQPKPPKFVDRASCRLPETREELAPFIKRTSYPGKGRSLVGIAFSGMPPYVSSENVAFDMMVQVLGGNALSRLSRRLREELGLVYQAKCTTWLFLDLIFIELSCDPNEVEFLVLQVLEVIRKLQNEPISEAELKEQSELAKFEVRAGADDLRTLSQSQYRDLITGRSMNLDDQSDFLASIQPEDIRRQAQALGLRGIMIYEAEEGVE